MINGFLMNARIVSTLDAIIDWEDLTGGAWGYGWHEVGSVTRVKGLFSKLVGLA